MPRAQAQKVKKKKKKLKPKLKFPHVDPIGHSDRLAFKWIHVESENMFGILAGKCEET